MGDPFYRKVTSRNVVAIVLTQIWYFLAFFSFYSQPREISDGTQSIGQMWGAKKRSPVQHGSVYHPDGGQRSAGAALCQPDYQWPLWMHLWNLQRRRGDKTSVNSKHTNSTSLLNHVFTGYFVLIYRNAEFVGRRLSKSFSHATSEKKLLVTF